VLKVLLLSFFIGSSFAQNMDISTKRSNASKAPAEIINLLKEDNTDKHIYVKGKFYCHNFASTLYLERSSLVTSMDAFDLEGIKLDWGVVITRLAESSKMPIYYVSLSNKESAFYHAINAVLVNQEKPSEISSYVFIEPQTDETFITPEDLYDRYRMYYDKDPSEEEPLHLRISTVDAIKHTEHGTAFQTSTNKLYDFDLKFK
jgi:hypothetical protein